MSIDDSNSEDVQPVHPDQSETTSVEHNLDETAKRPAIILPKGEDVSSKSEQPEMPVEEGDVPTQIVDGSGQATTLNSTSDFETVEEQYTLYSASSGHDENEQSESVILPAKSSQGDEAINAPVDGAAEYEAVPSQEGNDNPTDGEKSAQAQGLALSNRSSAEQALTSRQEKALRYIERKRNRQKRITAQIEAAKENGNGKQLTTPHASILSPLSASIAETPTTLLPAQGRNERNGFGSTAARMLAISIPTIARPKTSQSLRAQRHRKLLVRHFSRKHMRQAREEEQRSFSRAWKILATLAAVFVIIFLAITGGGAFAAYRFYMDTQTQFAPKINDLRALVPHDNLKMYDVNNKFIGQLTDEGVKTSVSLKQISQTLINATVATEDKNFWTNPGVDLLRILQAAIDNLRRGRVVEGGSTITQQLIKNLILTQDQNILRKLQEITLTPAINTRYTKQDIMEMYLNSIPYGAKDGVQIIGIDAAASMYFGFEDQPDKTAAQQLDIAQSAMLAGIPSSPSLYNPRLHPQAAFNRFKTVLDFMARNGYITHVQQLDAIDEAQKPDFLKDPPNMQNRAPHFFNFVLGELQKQFHIKDIKDLSRSDMKVYTTVDVNLQDQVQKIAQDQVEKLKETGHNASNASAVIIDFHTGAIRTLLGSIDYYSKDIDGQYDVATQGYRQPGSSFKPYVYVKAFEQGYSPASPISDVPISIPQTGGPAFEPKNYDLGYHGHLTIRCALQNSLNIPAVKALQHVGIDNAVQMAHDMGVDINPQGYAGYSLVLGGAEVHLLDHTSAYGTFADGGVHQPYYGVEKVVFAGTGQTINHTTIEGKRALSPQLAYMMTNVLSDNQSRLPEFYRCNVLQLYSNSQQDCYAGNPGTIIPAAAKTGTTNDFRDNWTMGYTAHYVMGVWVGNNDFTPMNNVTGVDGAAPIWHQGLLLAEQGKPIEDFKDPGGLVKKDVTYADGLHTSDLFMPDKVPTSRPASGGGNNTGSPTSTPSGNQPDQPVKGGAYCPNAFNFAFGPLPDNRNPGGPLGWW